ncbi:MAG: death-on-curing protein [Pseudomonas sp.]
MADSKEAPDQLAMSRQIQLFVSADGQAQLQVALEHDTVWLSQAQMGQLFDTTPENVLMHLKNIFNDGELAEPATTKDFLVVRQEGARQVRRRIKHYSLAAIISSYGAMQLLQKRQQLPLVLLWPL